ncbi:MAG: hypothetical protein P1S60_15790, partial [Anaerolineae bacterium]|nr:hypothetical protein [Anaerolineae bacterium]
YITDAAVNQSGMALDDIEFVVDDEILLVDDVENPNAGWIAEGFVRHANVLPQLWIIQLVTYGPETEVNRLLFMEGVSGEWTLPLNASTRSAVISISAIAPFTTEEAVYRYSLTQEP